MRVIIVVVVGKVSVVVVVKHAMSTCMCGIDCMVVMIMVVRVHGPPHEENDGNDYKQANAYPPIGIYPRRHKKHRIFLRLIAIHMQIGRQKCRDETTQEQECREGERRGDGIHNTDTGCIVVNQNIVKDALLGTYIFQRVFRQVTVIVYLVVMHKILDTVVVMGPPHTSQVIADGCVLQVTIVVAEICLLPG